jgi:hypothetical protein
VHIEFAVLASVGLFQKSPKANSNTAQVNTISNTEEIQNKVGAGICRYRTQNRDGIITYLNVAF